MAALLFMTGLSSAPRKDNGSSDDCVEVTKLLFDAGTDTTDIVYGKTVVEIRRELKRQDSRSASRSTSLVLCQLVTSGWPGLEGAARNPGASFANAQSSPGHLTLNFGYDRALAADRSKTVRVLVVSWLNTGQCLIKPQENCVQTQAGDLLIGGGFAVH